MYICRLKNSIIAAGTAIAGGPENPPQAYGPPQSGPRRPPGTPQYGSQVPGQQQVRFTQTHRHILFNIDHPRQLFLSI